MRCQILKNTTVLVVEDDEITRCALKLGLKGYCGSYYEAKNGFEGLEIFTKHRVDIIITDIHMPSLNGFDMMDWIQKIKPNQTFIVITSYDTDENFLRSLKHGAMHFIRKPLVIEDLQNALLLAAAKRESKNIILSPNIEVNLDNETIFVDKNQIFLTNLENRLFWLFCYNIDKIVSYEMVENFIYDQAYVKKGRVHTAILRLKKQLSGIRLENISSKGYILKKFS